MKRHHQGSKLRTVLILGIVVVLSSALTIIYYSFAGQQKNNQVILWQYSIDASVIVGSDNKIGMDADPDALRFGIVPRGGESERRFTISINNSNKDLEKIYARGNLDVIIKSSGNISQFLYFDKNNFIMKNSTEDITATVNIPQSVDVGRYEGRVMISLVSNKN